MHPTTGFSSERTSEPAALGAMLSRIALLLDTDGMVYDHAVLGVKKEIPASMLEIRPICEHCGKLLPANSTEAMICSFECTFCAPCVANVVENVCPNCRGGFAPRPFRPSANWRGNNYLGNNNINAAAYRY
jgi:hypothetical protein